MGFGNKVKDAIGIEGNTWEYLRPIVGYNAACITTGGVTEPIGSYHQQFLNFVEGLSPKMSGRISAISGVVEAIFDLAMGFITDRTRSRIGKHRVWIIAGLPVLLLGFFMQWYSFGISGINNENATFTYYLIAALVYGIGYIMINIPHTAMLPTIAPKYFERTQYKMVEYIYNAIGMFPSYFIMSFILGGVDMDNPAPEHRNLYLLSAIVLVIFFSWAPLVTFFTTKEPSSVGEKHPPIDFAFFFREYLQVFRNRSFRQYFFINLFYGFSKSFYRYADQYFMISIVERYKVFFMLNTVGGIAEAAGSPANYLLVRYIDKRTCGILLFPLMIIGLAINGFATPATPTFVIFIAAILYNFGFSGPGFVINNIQPDVTDVDELITGRRREGVISTFNSFVRKTLSSIVTAILGQSMDFFGYDTKHADYASLTDSAEFGIRLIVSWIPVIFAVISLILIFKFKMTKRDHEVIQQVIKEKHETGSCEISASDKKRLEYIAGHKWEDMWIGRTGIDRKLEEIANI